MESMLNIILILKVNIHEEQTILRRILQLNYTDNTSLASDDPATFLLPLNHVWVCIESNAL